MGICKGEGGAQIARVLLSVQCLRGPRVVNVVKATVAICTYNGAQRIGAVIQALSRQSMPLGTWELLVVDNGSTDNTMKVAHGLLRRLAPRHGKVVREERPGLAHARARAAAEALSDIVCFLDDDNIPSTGWLESAVDAFGRRPGAGAIGGKVIARWEAAPSPLALAVQEFALAICDRGDDAFCYSKNRGPVGAGLCVRTSVLRQVFRVDGGASQVLGRAGAKLASGDDVAICVLVWKLGWECWYEPMMVVEHQLPKRRMDKMYLLELYDGIGRGQCAVRRLHDWKARSPLAWLIGVKDLARALCLFLRGIFTTGCRAETALASDLLDLQVRLMFARAKQTLVWPF